MSRKTRKLIWSAPLVAVLAVAGVLAMFVALEPGNVFANPLPAAPMNLDVNPASGVAGRTTLVVTWDAPAGGNVTGYRIDKSDDSFVWETLVGKDSPHGTASYTDNTLTASDTRWYRVFAINDHGEGPVSDPDDGITRVKGKPGPVRNFRAAAMGQRQINLTWDLPADNGGEKISGYEIQYHDGQQWVGLLATTPTMENYLVVTEKARMENGGYQDKDTAAFSLDPGEMRRYQIRAVNSEDPEMVTPDDRAEEPKATEGWVRADATTVSATAPAPPTGLTAVNTAAENVSLYWFAPELKNNGGWPVTDYLIQVRRAGTNWLDIPDADDLAVLTPELKDGGAIIAAGANFRVSVGETETNTQKTFAGVPVMWDDDGDDGESDQTDEVPLWLEFRVFSLTTDDGVNDTDDGAVDANSDDILIIGTSPSETSYRVRAVARVLTDADGDDPDGDNSDATPDADQYGPPTLLATGSDSASDRPTPNGDVMKEEIQLAIRRPEGVGTQNIYRIDYSEDAGMTWKLLVGRTTFTGFDGNRRYQHTDLGYDATRHYRAFAVRSDWRTTAGRVSVMVNGMTTNSKAPGEATNVMASAPDLETIQASWSGLADNGGRDIVKYIYQYVIDDGDDVPDANDWTGENPKRTVVGGETDDASEMASITASLIDQKLYHFRVASVNKDQDDNFRPTGPTDEANVPKWGTASFITGEAVAPNMVEGITSEAAKDSSGNVRGVDVFWNKPNSGDDDIDHYIIERSMDGGTTWESPTEDAKTSDKLRTAYTDPRHHVAGETLAYRVAAKNDAGMSDWVMVYYPRDPADDHMHPPTTAALTAPTGLTATPGTLELNWTPGDGATMHWVYAIRADEGEGGYTFMQASSNNSHTLKGLDNGAEYIVAVSAGKGRLPGGEWSAWTSTRMTPD